MTKRTPAIVILHGWGLSASRFNALGDALTKKGYKVYIPDFPGFGDAPPPTRPFTLADYAAFLSDYINSKKLQSVVLIGHSFGGRVSLKYSMGNPDVLRGLILTGTPGFTPIARRKLIAFILFAKIGKFFFSIWPLNHLQEKIRLWYYWLVGAREFYRAEGTMRETFKLIVKEDLLVPMKAVHVPCLLVWGGLDQITPVWIAQKMKSTIAKSKLIIIPEKDHGVPFKEPEVFVSHIESFLKET